MRSRHIFWGLILILIGALFILKNLEIIYFSWGALLRLWPVLLILLGISLLPIKTGGKLLFSAIAIIIALVLMFNSDHYWHWKPIRFGNGWYFGYHHDDYEEYDWQSEEITEPYNEDIGKAVLIFDAAIGEFTINSTTEELLDFEKEGNMGPYRFATQSKGGKYYITLDLKDNFLRGSKLSNKANVKLNKNPEWELDIDVAAADIEMDLTPFKVRELNIDGGASDIEIKLSDLLNEVAMNIDASASSISILIPEDFGCELDASTVLTNRDLEGMEKYKDGIYRSFDFNNSQKRVYINMNAAIADISIEKY